MHQRLPPGSTSELDACPDAQAKEMENLAGGPRDNGNRVNAATGRLPFGNLDSSRAKCSGSSHCEHRHRRTSGHGRHAEAQIAQSSCE